MRAILPYVLACLLSTDASALDLPPYTLPATIDGHTFQEGAITIYNDGSYSISYYNRNALYPNPTHYAPYDRWDIWWSEKVTCTGNDFANDTSCTWNYVDAHDPYDWEQYANLGHTNVNDIVDVDGHVYSSMDIRNTNSTLSYQGTVYKAANWNFPDTPFVFPLQTTCNSVPCTAYTAEVSSVMDQSTLGTGAAYDNSDGEIESFEGEIANVGPYTGSTCYAKSDNSEFGSSIDYVGTTGTGGEYYLCYNGHPGYDYPAPLQEGERMDINAPESGTLCVATTATEPDDPPVLWRDATHCPYSTAGGTSWSGYHTFYIIHDGLRMNGTAGTYMTVFLHNDSLSSTVQSAIEQNGYAAVLKDDFIAKAGGWGPSGASHYSLHMHFEVYKWNGSSWDRVDPYGDGTTDILWEH